MLNMKVGRNEKKKSMFKELVTGEKKTKNQQGVVEGEKERINLVWKFQNIKKKKFRRELVENGEKRIDIIGSLQKIKK